MSAVRPPTQASIETWSTRGSNLASLAGVVAIALAAAALLVLARFDAAVLLEYAAQLGRPGQAALLDLAAVHALQGRALLLGGVYGAVAGSVLVFHAPVRRNLAWALAWLLALPRRLADAWSHLGARDRRDALTVTALTLLAGLLAVLHVQQVIRLDEASTFRAFGTRPIFVSLCVYLTPNNHVLHSVLLKLSTLVFGDALWAIRLPALTGAVTLVPLAYGVGRRYFDRDVALITAGLLASSAALVDLATNARGYSLMIGFFLAMLLVAPSAVEGRRSAWVGVVVLAALGAWTVPVMVLPFATVVLFMIAAQLRARGTRELGVFARRLGGATAATAVAVTLLYSPMLLTVGLVPSDLATILQKNTADSPAALAARSGLVISWLWDLVTLTWPQWLAAVSLALVGIGAGASLVRWRSAFVLLWAAIVPLVVFTVATGIIVPPWSLSFFTPLYLAFAAAGAAWIMRFLTGRPWPLAAATLVVALNLATLTAADYPRDRLAYIGYPDAPEAARHLADSTGSGVRYVGSMIDLRPVSYYLYRRGLPFECPLHVPGDGARTVWVIDCSRHAVDAADLEALGREGYRLMETRDLSGSRLLRYERRG